MQSPSVCYWTVQSPKIKFWSASSNSVGCVASPNSGDFARRKAPTGGEIPELWYAQLAKSPRQPAPPPPPFREAMTSALNPSDRHFDYITNRKRDMHANRFSWLCRTWQERHLLLRKREHMRDRKLVGSWQRSLSCRFILPRRERPLLAGKIAPWL